MLLKACLLKTVAGTMTSRKRQSSVSEGPAGGTLDTGNEAGEGYFW